MPEPGQMQILRPKTGLGIDRVGETRGRETQESVGKALLVQCAH
jgi:hypothetical protein